MSNFIKFFETNTLDFSVEKETAINTYKEYILNGRQLVPSLWIYSPSDTICSVQGKPFNSEEDHSEQIVSMMLLASAAKAEHVLLTFGFDVEFIDGIVRSSIVTILANHTGSLAEPFAYSLENDNVVFDKSLELPADKMCYPNTINHILAMGMKIKNAVDKPSKVVGWLSSQNFDIQFYNEYNQDTVDYITFSI